MAPAQLVEPKDLPPEIGPVPAEGVAARPAPPQVEARAPVPESTPAAAAIATSAAATPSIGQRTWENGLEAEALELLASGRQDVWEELTKRFEAKLILTALANTRGRRIEAAQKLGIGRNTITRKIQELGLE
jgi:two-component system, NtrC family, nitrogen regulation response regulator GlnG